jgi:hypothetical protein
VERQHGSSEEARWQKEQSRPKRIGEKGRSDTCAEQGGTRGGAEEASVGRFDPNETEKPAMSPAFLLSRYCHLE